MPNSAAIVLDLFARTEHHRYGRARQQRADLHVPREGGPHPVVALVHGGYWRATYGKVVMKPLAADLVRRGFATWNVEYRRIGRRQGGGFPATFDDVRDSLNALAALGDERLDMSDLTLMGHSAGGHLALWAAGRDDIALEPSRVIAQAPITDLVACGEPAHALMGGTPGEHPERYSECDPIQQVPLPMPVCIVHGSDDATIALARSQAYAEAARAAGGQVELIEPVPGGHRSHIDPRSKAWRAAIDWLEGAVSPRSTSQPAAR